MANTTSGGTAPRPTDPATGTVSDSTNTEAKTETASEQHKPGDVWSEEVTLPQAEQVDQKIREQAAKEDKMRRDNPNSVVYRRAEEKSD